MRVLDNNLNNMKATNDAWNMYNQHKLEMLYTKTTERI